MFIDDNTHQFTMPNLYYILNKTMTKIDTVHYIFYICVMDKMEQLHQ